MKFIEWVEPYNNSEMVPVYCRMRPKHVLKVQIDKNPLYGSFSEKAIWDFIVVNWATIGEGSFIKASKI